MKYRMLALLLLLLATTGCTSWHKAAGDVNVGGEDVVYLKDDRTNLCFAVLFLGNKTGTSVENMGITAVPCEKLENVSVR